MFRTLPSVLFVGLEPFPNDVNDLISPLHLSGPVAEIEVVAILRTGYRASLESSS